MTDVHATYRASILSQEARSNKIYDEVDDEEYRTVVRARLDEDDFIEDDGCEGYIDNGEDDWDRRRRGSDEDEDDEDDSDDGGQSDAAQSWFPSPR